MAFSWSAAGGLVVDEPSPLDDVAKRWRSRQEIEAKRTECNHLDVFSFCEGFRMPALTLAWRLGTGAGVRNPPGKEPAGDLGRLRCRAMGI